jgi:hypothetical protein
VTCVQQRKIAIAANAAVSKRRHGIRPERAIMAAILRRP